MRMVWAGNGLGRIACAPGEGGSGRLRKVSTLASLPVEPTLDALTVRRSAEGMRGVDWYLVMGIRIGWEPADSKACVAAISQQI